jgi:hypothetical protein
MNVYLMKALHLAPLAVERLVLAIPSGQYDERSDPERFTLREAVAHLADWEPIFLSRMKSGVERNGAEVFGIDESVRSIEMHYGTTEIPVALEAFKTARAETVAWLESLEEEDWLKHVKHNERGNLSTREHANMIVGHDMYHVEHLTQYLHPAEKVASTW